MIRKTTQILTIIVMIVMLISGFFYINSSSKKNNIVIAGGNTSERQLLSEIQKQMIQHYMKDAKVEIINNLGSTTLIVQTFIKDICNMSGAMYTGTSLTGELGLDAQTDTKKALELVKKGYKEKFNMKWYDSYGFENTYTFMVRRDFAEKNNITKLSDLKNIASTLNAGVDTSWMQRKGDGYEDFKQKYKYDFKKVYPMEISLVYDAVKNGEMDLVLGYSTDGRINSYDLVILKDDMHVFPPYDACPVASYELLEKYPQLDDVINKIVGNIDSKTMQKLNRISDEEQVEPKNVAKQFLQEHNYFENKDSIAESNEEKTYKTNDVKYKIVESKIFTEEEIKSAMDTVKDNFSFPYTSLKEISYDDKKSTKMAKDYFEYKKYKYSEKNTMVLYSTFDVDKNSKNPVLNVGTTYEGFMWNMYRKDKNSKWEIVGFGY